MCVYSHKPLEKKIAEKDIEVRKLLYCKSRKLLSPYMMCDGKVKSRYNIDLTEEEISWTIGETKTVELAEITTKMMLSGFPVYITSKGLYSIHVGENIPHGSNYKMFKAIIPVGSEYYEGHGGYCSSALKIIEECV